MKFTCLDFETANASRSSVCSVGISVYENGELLEEKYWMVKPEPLYFDNRNIQVHNIREIDVINEKTFDELWDEIKPYLDGQIVIAHNASFDMSVLRHVLDSYEIEYPQLQYCCSLVASRIFYNYLPNHKLNTVVRYLGYDNFKHHHASADATACGFIISEMIKELDIDDIDSFAEIVGFSVGTLGNDNYTPCKKVRDGYVSSKLASYEGIEGPTFDEDVDFFRDKYVVFTGPLGIYSRDEASEIVTKLGGIVWGGVTKKTNILVTNTENPDSIDPLYLSSKLKTAVRYRKQGQDIKIINADEFQNIIMGYPYAESEDLCSSVEAE